MHLQVVLVIVAPIGITRIASAVRLIAEQRPITEALELGQRRVSHR